jgi:diguanylate cyclase (GGDEF)-like protein/PAS domain S-box-containing protein
LLRVPVVAVTIPTTDGVHAVAQVGLATRRLGHELGLCLTTISEGRLRVVEHAERDPGTAMHPLVSGPLGLRFYAGVPLRLSSGSFAGAFEIMDSEPRSLSHSQLDLLEVLGGLAAHILEYRLSNDRLIETQLRLSGALERESRLAAIIDGIPEATFTVRLNGTMAGWNPAAEELFGYTADEVLGKPVMLLLSAGDAVRVRRALGRIAMRERVHMHEIVHQTKDGLLFEAADTLTPIVDWSGNVVEAAWSTRDVRELRRLEAIVWEEKERAELAYDMIRDAVIMTDVEGRITYLNPVAERLTGRTTPVAHGLPAHQVVRLVHRESLEPVESPLEAALREARWIQLSDHNLVVHRDGDTVSVEDTAGPVRDRDGQVVGAVLVLHPHADVDPARDAGTYLLHRDGLTGLLHKRELEHRIEQALISAARDSTQHALLFLALRRFRIFVEEHGRVAGAELLRQIAVLLRTQVRDADSLARLHDDEFCILLLNCPLYQARRIAEQITKTINDFHFYWEGQELEMTARIGLVPVTADSGGAANVLRLAEIACHNARARGKPRIHTLDAGDVNRAVTAGPHDHGGQITAALADDRFRMYGQTIIPLHPDAVYGEQCEMLLHMEDETGRIIPPAGFLPAAERADLLRTIDRWVVRTVFRMLRENRPPQIASWTINLSEASLIDETFQEFVREQFAYFEVPPQWVCFELDETVAFNHLGDALRLVSSLRPLGYAFCLSHFGTSLNSFAYLRNLRVDYLKIDGTLVRDIVTDSIDRAIVSAVSHVAHAMGMRTIAEKVEAEDVLECLRTLGIDYAQGYVIGEPVPLFILS